MENQCISSVHSWDCDEAIKRNREKAGAKGRSVLNKFVLNTSRCIKIQYKWACAPGFEDEDEAAMG